MKVIRYSILLLSCASMAQVKSMEEEKSIQTAQPQSNNVASLRELVISHIIQEPRYENNYAPQLNGTLPQELIEEIQNKKNKVTRTAHFYAGNALELEQKIVHKELTVRKRARLSKKRTDNLKTLKKAIQQGASPHYQDKKGKTLAHIMAEIEDDHALRILEEIIKKGACLHVLTTDSLKTNVLERACIYTNLQAVKFLSQETTASVDLPEADLQGIEPSKPKQYILDNSSIFQERNKQFDIYRYVLAPCCIRGGHPRTYTYKK